MVSGTNCLANEVFSLPLCKSEMLARAVPNNYPFLSRALKEGRIRIVTDHGDPEYVGTIRKNLRSGRSSTSPLVKLLGHLRLGFSLFGAGSDVVYVTYGDSLASYILMSLQFLLLPFRRPSPHVILGCLWEKGASPERKLLVWLRSVLVNSTVQHCVVNGEHDLRTFSGELGIAREKLKFLHYHHTLDDFDGPVSEGDYVFSGGYDGRDYAPLIRACSELNLPLKIATSDPVAQILASGHPKFEVRETTSREFLEWMAGSRLVVLSYGQTLLRTGGHQTFINAMMMKKAVIIFSRPTAEGYFEDGKNGIVIDSGDYDRLRREIEAVYHFDAVRSALGTNGFNWVQERNLCLKEWMYRVYDLALRGYYERER